MAASRLKRGEMSAFLDAQADLIRSKLGSTQNVIAHELWDRITPQHPDYDLASMQVALSRWLKKQGWSGRKLQALLASEGHSELSEPPPAIIAAVATAAEAPKLPSVPKVAGPRDAPSLPSLAPRLNTAGPAPAGSQNPPLKPPLASTAPGPATGLSMEPRSKAKTVVTNFFKPASHKEKQA